tara:strand:+ start:1050 stop:1550 length:501 start_codon:yes stop_codon:yes gene_type:complete
MKDQAKTPSLPFDMNEIYKNYFWTAVGIALPIVKNHQLAQDIAQDSLIKVWLKQDTFDGTKGKFYTWLKIIVVRKAYDRYRTDSKREILRDDCGEWNSFTCPCVNIDTLDLELNLNKITLKYRVVLYLKFIEGETFERISERLNTPLGTVKGQARRGMKELRKIYT